MLFEIILTAPVPQDTSAFSRLCGIFNFQHNALELQPLLRQRQTKSFE